MTDLLDPERRSFLISLACSIASTPIWIKGFDDPYYVTWESEGVDWGEVINEVILHHNDLNAGGEPEPQSFPIGSPHWCMEQLLENAYG